MVILRPVARLMGAVWMIVIALFGLAVALYCLDGLIKLGSARPDRLVHSGRLSRHVGRFLEQIAAPGSTAWLAVLCGPGRYGYRPDLAVRDGALVASAPRCPGR